MESVMLLCFARIHRDALKIFCKNGKIMACIALFTLLTESILYLSTSFTIKPLIIHLLMERNLLHFAAPNTPEFTYILAHIRKEVNIIFGLECIYIILDLVAFILSATATILASAITHGGKNDNLLSLKDLVLRTARSLKKTLVTSLYTTLFRVVYLFLFLAILFSIKRVIKSLIILSPVAIGVVSIFLLVCGIVFYYLSAICSLAIVVSGVEEIRGIQAVSKAIQICKGMKLQGFLLSLIFNIPSIVLVAAGIKMSHKAQSLAVDTIVGLVVVNSFGLLGIYKFAAFTVFYYRCNKTRGQRIELEERLDGYSYSKIPTNTTASVVDHSINIP